MALCGCSGRLAVPVAPAPCNALQRTDAGLLVPRTEMEGEAPGTAVGTGRSVDIDVAAPAADDCPAAWTVGARLTPAWGQVEGSETNLLAGVPEDVWVPLAGASVVLPEAGVYEILADVDASIITQGPVVNGQIVARLFDTTAAAPVPGTSRLVVLYSIIALATPTSEITNSSGATAGALYQVAGPVTVRAEAQWDVDSGNVSLAAATAVNMRFRKVAD
ncbi:hypothetical protein [Streptomyces sp. NPDC047070]|uniref:hypothetical protein n=1 Tax=Streptomyces sp. NPDC047070 TaxID=3154923 RepID=UPI00345200A7